MKVLSLFSGIGAFEKALKNLGVEYELVGYCEIDKYASKAYSQIHKVSEDKNFGDITKIKADELPKDIDLITYGFPCQDISVAGKQKGFADKDGKTRSGLFFDALRIIETAQPQIAIAENVKNLTSKKFKTEFEIVLKSLEKAGYKNYWKVLNAKHYGIPQNRERVFIVSIRKDVDEGFFSFPQPFPLKLRLKDLLEDEVEDKYYLSGVKAQKLIKTITENNNVTDRVAVDGTINDPQIKEISNCIISRYDAGVSNQKSTGCMVIEPVCARSQGRNPDDPSDRTAGAPTVQRLEINKNGTSNTITTVQKDNYIIEPLKIKEATKKGYAEANLYDSITLDQPNSKTRRGRVGNQISNTLLCSCNVGVVEPKIVQMFNPYNNANITDIAPAQTTTCGITTGSSDVLITYQNLRIRKLTPLECWRLMGFDDEDFDAVQGISNAQLYKQAGNSIVVDVLEHIFLELMRERYIA